MSSPRYPNVFIHETAIVNSDAIGAGTRIWAFCNLLPGSRLGAECQICDRVFIENGVVIGDGVTVKCGVSIWTGVIIEDGVVVGPDVVFTNDPHPRAGRHLARYPETRVRRYASLGAGSVLLPGITIGEYALTGAGAVVTSDVESFALVIGNPARRVGWVCVCAARLRGPVCEECGRTFEYDENTPPRLISGSDNPAVS